MSGQRFDPLKIVQAFNRRGVEYVVIGGYAGELHAAAVPPTRDIEFTPPCHAGEPRTALAGAHRS